MPAPEIMAIIEEREEINNEQAEWENDEEFRERKYHEEYNELDF